MHLLMAPAYSDLWRAWAQDELDALAAAKAKVRVLSEEALQRLAAELRAHAPSSSSLSSSSDVKPLKDSKAKSKGRTPEPAAKATLCGVEGPHPPPQLPATATESEVPFVAPL
jgi:hypothetical protein